MPTDETLFAAWRQGDQRAGHQLYLRHFALVHRFFLNKTSSDVEDLVQRTFVASVESAARFEGRSSFRTYLLGIAKNILFESYRKRVRNREVDFEHDGVADMAAGPSTLFAEGREQRTLLEALRHIPLKYQVVLELSYWEKITGPEIGEILGLTADGAYSRVRLAKEHLRRALAKLDASPALLESTDADLESWAASVRAGMPSPAAT